MQVKSVYKVRIVAHFETEVKIYEGCKDPVEYALNVAHERYHDCDKEELKIIDDMIYDSEDIKIVDDKSKIITIIQQNVSGKGTIGVKIG